MTNLVKWVATNIFAEGQRIYRTTEEVPVEELTNPIATVSADVSSYEDTEGTSDSLYIIEAYKGNNSEWSNWISEIKVSSVGEGEPSNLEILTSFTSTSEVEMWLLEDPTNYEFLFAVWFDLNEELKSICAIAPTVLKNLLNTKDTIKYNRWLSTSNLFGVLRDSPDAVTQAAIGNNGDDLTNTVWFPLLNDTKILLIDLIPTRGITINNSQFSLEIKNCTYNGTIQLDVGINIGERMSFDNPLFLNEEALFRWISEIGTNLGDRGWEIVYIPLNS